MVAERESEGAGEIDEVTLARARRGDRAAQGAFVGCYERRVFALVGRMLADAPADVDDVAQEAFVKALRSIGGFDPRGAARLSTWLLTIAVRTALDALRHRKVTVRLFESPGRETTTGEADADDSREAVETRGCDPWDGIAQRDLGRRVERAVAALAPDFRAVLVLRAYHDLDYPEIARALGIDVGTVKSRLSRARASLREALGDEVCEA